MPEYNPIVRTFGNLRAALILALGVRREDIRPATLLDSLIPADRRRATWKNLHDAGFSLPPLTLSEKSSKRTMLGVLEITASLALSTKGIGLAAGIPIGVLAYWLTRPWAVHIWGPRTIGELVLYLTSVREHRKSGYRWTRNEIATKVRFLVAESTGLSFDRIKPESTFAELGIFD